MSELNRTEYDSIRSVMIVGCGRLGSAFAEALTRKGFRVVAVSARRRHSSMELREKLGLSASFVSIDEASRAESCDLTLVTVPDDAIHTVAGELATAGIPRPGMIVAHPSGSKISAEIAPCRSRGAITASLHPLQTFPRGIGDGERFEGITFAFEGEAGAIAPLRELAFRLGADLFEVPADRKAEYHTAAVLACNCLVALMAVAVRLFGHVGSLPGESMTRLRPLIDATLDNITELGAVGALTGPVARGDAGTVATQIEVVRRHLPDYLPLYKELSRCLVELAAERGDADAAGLERIRELVDSILEQASDGEPAQDPV